MINKLPLRDIIKICKIINHHSYTGKFHKTNIYDLLNSLNINLITKNDCNYLCKSCTEDMTITLNDKPTSYDRQLNISFALGHLLMYGNHISTLESVKLNDVKERNAFNFAIELLVPARMISRIASRSRHSENQLAEMFGVSTNIIQYSLERLM